MQYSFRYKSLNQQEQINILGTSLLVYMIKDDNMYNDIRILNKILAGLCDWTKMNILLIIHSNHQKSKDEIDNDIELLV